MCRVRIIPKLKRIFPVILSQILVAKNLFLTYHHFKILPEKIDSIFFYCCQSSKQVLKKGDRPLSDLYKLKTQNDVRLEMNLIVKEGYCYRIPLTQTYSTAQGAKTDCCHGCTFIQSLAQESLSYLYWVTLATLLKKKKTIYYRGRFL